MSKYDSESFINLNRQDEESKYFFLGLNYVILDWTVQQYDGMKMGLFSIKKKRWF